ncbi:hypothetical protein MIH18_14395 [Marinobacter sp. M3C]|jgi:uncharacterized membrane protein|uniref:hypothetical protein n=1 Tax=Marinobacter sp. M3C TaxID=2917715 RepID=UPI00200CFDD7|nr:hypothetical protein [Marinobacter sp. M3C]UQG58938.1 hypothetical protein MIH18_14395 [Marinobacter sp. M3C]
MFDSAAIKSTIRKAAAALIGFVMALILLAALLLTGLHLLVSAGTLALAPLVGQAGAMAISGLVCVLLVALFFYRLVSPGRSSKDQSDSEGSAKPASRSPIQTLRSAITDNPLEAIAIAFAAGIAGHDDSRLRRLLLQGGMAMMEQPEKSAAAPAEPQTPGADTPP